MVASTMVRSEVNLRQEILLKTEFNMEAISCIKVFYGKIGVTGKAGSLGIKTGT